MRHRPSISFKMLSIKTSQLCIGADWSVTGALQFMGCAKMLPPCATGHEAPPLVFDFLESH